MSEIIICTHGKTAQELLNSVEMIMGKQEDVSTIDFMPGESLEDVIEKYIKVLNTIDDDKNILIIVDLYGGSPFNAALRLALENENINLITGVNIPMLLEVFLQKEQESDEELINIALDSGKAGIDYFDRKRQHFDQF